MHKEILTPTQTRLLPLVRVFSNDFGLVGGTAIALHIGHRESIDFDLFTTVEFDNRKIKRKIARVVPVSSVITDETGQYTLSIREVKFTFFQFPYNIPFTEYFEEDIRLPNLLTLAAMKAFALGNRAKWKDYVDMYFILKDHHSIKEIDEKAKELFGREYNTRNFRAQLAFFDDINYSEEITFKNGFSIDDVTVKAFLIERSLDL